MLNLKTSLIIIASLLSFTYAQCPIAWWPLGYFSKNVTFFTEVMKGNDIGYLTLNPAAAAFAGSSSIYGIPDRIGANSARSISFIQSGQMALQVNFLICIS